VASNLLIHREYTSGATTRLIIEYGRVVTDNPSRPHGFGRLDPATTVPFQKNPVIGAFFRQIDRADELGSGMRKMMLYGKAYGGADPELTEGDIFRMVIRVPEFGANPAEIPQVVPVTEQVTGEATDEEAGEVTGEVLAFLKVLKTVPMGRKDVQNLLSLKGQANFRERYLEPALSGGLVEMTQPDSPKSPTQKYRLTEKGRLTIISLKGR
jgi:ATP-dependent DNA helicase RecG